MFLASRSRFVKRNKIIKQVVVLVQLSLFSNKQLEDMVEDGRYFIATRMLELQRMFPRQDHDMTSYVDALIMHDIARGRLEMPSLTMSKFDEYLAHVKRVCDDDVYMLIEKLKEDFEHMYETRYAPSKIRQLYPQLSFNDKVVKNER
jgi:hypothetical protein